MKDINEFFDGELPIKKGIGECKECGAPYDIWEHKGRIVEICQACNDDEMRKKYNIPTAEEHRKEKEMQRILFFEKVSDDLKIVTVRSYNAKHETQQKAKQEIIKFVKSFADNKNQSLVFSGGVGLGKSHLAYAAAKAIRDQGYTALFIKTTHLLEQIKKTYSGSFDFSKLDVGAAQSEEEILKMIEGLDLLVLDDLGSEYVKSDEYGHESWASDILFRVYDSRLNKATITTTNYSDREMQLKYGNNGPRIIDRMIDNATGIRFEGDSFRRKKNVF